MWQYRSLEQVLRTNPRLGPVHLAQHPAPLPVVPTGLQRARRWGRAVALTWYLGGFVVLFVCAISQIGPSAWVAAWQVRHWGFDNVLGSFLPGFAVLLLPVVVLAILPRRADWPFVSGAKEAVWSRHQSPRAVLPLDRRLRLFRKARWIAAGLAATCLLATCIACWVSLAPGAQAVGSPLPELTPAAVSVPGVALPGYARIIGSTARRESAWEHDEILSRTSIQDLYVPLTAPGWRPGDPVDLLQLDHRSIAGQPGPPEGTLSHGVPAWLLASMREAGLAVTGDPVVLTRQALGGVVPAPDGIAAVISVILGGALTVTFGMAALSFHLAGRRLLTPAGR